MTVLHTVAAESSGSGTRDKVYISAMEALAHKCKKPDSERPYIISLKSGRQNSKDGNDKNFDLIFIFEFENVEDRDYFAMEDPVHMEFVTWVIEERKGLDFAVLDFEVGKW